MIIINTKLHAPKPTLTYCERPRLITELNRGLQCRTSLICAPAGFGKSSLVSAWAHGLTEGFAWLQLDAANGTPHSFMCYLVAAVQKARPQAMANAQSLVGGNNTLSAEDLWLAFVNDACDLPGDLVIVLDDYHTLESSECDHLLTQLIEFSPAQLHWFICTREDPSLPLAKWRAGGRLMELRAQQLAFSEAEAEHYLQLTLNTDLSKACVQALVDKTEGWPAALQLAALSLKSQTDIEAKVAAFTGSNRFITDYLMAEVMASLNPELTAFIASTAHLPRFCQALASAVTGAANAELLITRLEQDNVFLIPLDDQRTWYRYHHLFADVVTSQYSHHGIAKHQVHAKAARWFEAQGNLPEAIDSAKDAALAGEQNELLAELIENHWPSLRDQLPESSFINWMQALPKSVTAQHPVLAAYYGLALLSEQFELGCEYLTLAENPPANPVVHNQTAVRSVLGIVNIGKAYIHGAQGDFSATIGYTENALALLPASDTVWQGAANALRGLQHWWVADFSQATNCLRKAVLTMECSNDYSAQFSTRYLLASAMMAFGRVNQCLHETKVSLSRVEALNGIVPQGTVDSMVLHADCLIEQNQLQQAQGYLSQAENINMAAQLPESRHTLPWVRAKLAIALGQYDIARAELAAAAQLKSHSPTPELLTIDHTSIELARLTGQWPEVVEWAEGKVRQFALTDTAGQLEIHLGNAGDLLELALICLALQEQPNICPTHLNLALAENLTRQLITWATQAECFGVLLSAYLAHSQWAWLQQQNDLALENLNRAFTIAEQQGFIRRLLVSPAVGALLPKLKPGSYPSVVQTLNQALANKTEEPAAPQLIEPLSDREQQVLQQLDSELSGPEIAAKLFVSLNTFRTHSKNIYTKLGVNSRRSAIAAAKALRLIP